jgi:hypothetical protein
MFCRRFLIQTSADIFSIIGENFIRQFRMVLLEKLSYMMVKRVIKGTHFSIDRFRKISALIFVFSLSCFKIKLV